jgi:hypothetical protein
LKLISTKPWKITYNKSILFLYCFCFLLLGLFLGWKNVPGFLKANFILLSNTDIIPALFEKNDLNTIYLDIKFKNFQKLDKKRQEAICYNRLVSSDDDFVKAQISLDNQKKVCKLRLKGDLPDHWTGEKYSLRVEMKDGGLIKGMSRFSLQNPVTRNNSLEWLFLNNLRKENCISVRYEFVNLVINGKKMGVYAMEEHFSKELIESNNKREGVIVNFNDELLWKKFPKDLYSNIEWNSIFRSSIPEVRNSKRITNSAELKKQRDHALNLLRQVQESKVPASEIFSVEETSKFLAISHLWNAERGLLFADINFYFNPITCKLEPIGFDGNPGSKIEVAYCYFTWGDIKDNWVNYALQDQDIIKSYINYLSKFSSPAYLNSLKKAFFHQERHIRRILMKEKLGKSSSEIWQNQQTLLNISPWDILVKRTKRIRNELRNEHLLTAFALIDKESNGIEITTRNITTQPLEIESFEWGTKKWKAVDCIKQLEYNDIWIEKDRGNLIATGQGNGFKQTEFENKFKIPLEGDFSLNLINNHPFILNVRFLGQENRFVKVEIPIEQNIFVAKDYLFNKSDDIILPSFISSQNNYLLIKPGQYDVLETIRIPMGKTLFISPGVTLSFSHNATVISESPIHALGTKQKPILMQPIKENWGGILLANIEELSSFENVTFKNLKGVGMGTNPIIRNGWTMTGGLTVYKSSSIFSHCIFDNFMSEDALNIVSSSFTLDSCVFSNLYSDAFDGDFVQGEIYNCTFSFVQGDGVDFSGSEVSLADSTFENIKDKAVSVGEGSQVNINSIIADDVGFGVVSKDTSTVSVRSSQISGASIAAFAAYQKKNTFGPAKLTINSCEIIDSNNQFLVQDGSSIWNNGIRIQTVQFNVSGLYQNQEKK